MFGILGGWVTEKFFEKIKFYKWFDNFSCSINCET